MPSGFNSKNYITWSDVNAATIGLASRIKKYGFKPARILAVARGGLIPATMLSHLLDVREIYSAQLVSYNGEHVQEADIQGFVDYDSYCANEGLWDQADTLIVDDLWDSGKTHAFLRECLPKAVTTTLFYKDRGDESHRVVSFPGAPLNKDKWVVFPWEII